jgi:hypothetical protein
VRLWFLLFLMSSWLWAEPRWEPVVPMDRQLFPSYLLAISMTDHNKDDGFPHSTEGAGMIGFLVRDLPDNSRLRYSIKVPGLVEANFEDTYKVGGKLVWVLRPLPWNYEALRNIKQPYPSSASFRLSVNGKDLGGERVVQIGVRSVNEALVGYEYRSQGQPWKYKDTMFSLAAFVNEDHPWIDKLLKEALDQGIVSAFDGYQSGNSDQYLKQMLAVWQVLQKRGFRYSSITKSSVANEHVRSQYVRLFEDSINTAQSNCVDGTVLWASILRKIGFRTYLVFIPGHCFLGVDVGDRKQRIVGLETTMMGEGDSASPDSISKTFFAALKVGTQTFEDNLSKLGNAYSPYEVKNPNYQFVDVAEARRRHVISITRSSY